MTTKKDTQGVGSALSWLVVGILLWAPLAFWRGYVIVALWGMFATPLAPDYLAAPTIYAAVGLVFLIQALSPFRHESDTHQVSHFTVAVLAPGLLLIFGHLWQWLHWGAL